MMAEPSSASASWSAVTTTCCGRSQVSKVKFKAAETDTAAGALLLGVTTTLKVFGRRLSSML